MRGVVFSGIPYSVAQAEAPQIDYTAIHGSIPLLAVCYGAQYLVQKSGGEVSASETREYGRANLPFADAVLASLVVELEQFDTLGIKKEVELLHLDTERPRGHKTPHFVQYDQNRQTQDHLPYHYQCSHYSN